MTQEELPAERRLRVLAERFATADAWIRTLMARAPDGDRRALLAAALTLLIELRRDADASVEAIEHAYDTAARAVGRLTGKSYPDASRAYDLGRSLASRLDQAVLQVEANSRVAFAQVTADTLKDSTELAVLAARTESGRRLSLAAEGPGLIRTLGRRAVSRAGRDVLGDHELVNITGGNCPLCIPKQGVHSASVEPPFHRSCDCVALPFGFSSTEYVEAME